MSRTGAASASDSNRSTNSWTPAPPSSRLRRRTTTRLTRRPSTVQNRQVADRIEDEIRLTDKPKVIIIGGGPNRIGQGIEFDYCCVHAAFAMKELGIESVMINSNPETVSTDYDTSDLLFFEPLTHEDMLNICERLNGGPFERSTKPAARRSRVTCRRLEESRERRHRPIRRPDPLNLAHGLQEAGVPILGTTVESIDAAGDREQFRDLLQKLDLKQPANGIARNIAEAREIAARNRLSRPRPPQLRPRRPGDGDRLRRGPAQLLHDPRRRSRRRTSPTPRSSSTSSSTTRPKCDVDCLADFDPAGSGSGLGSDPKPDDPEPYTLDLIEPHLGVMEHIEEAGIHSRRLRLRPAALLPLQRDHRRAQATKPATSPRPCASAA